MNVPGIHCIPAAGVKADRFEIRPADIVPPTVASVSTTSPMEDRFSNRAPAAAPQLPIHFNPIIDSPKGLSDLHLLAMSTWD
jgi:hypothetical protein